MSARNDGDGWVETPNGKRWGKYGAAGLLLFSHTETGELVVLMQHRAEWVAQGGLWALPGGAINSTELASQAALREAYEEAGIDPTAVCILTQQITATCGDWSYTTVIGRSKNPLIGESNAEAIEHRWVPADQVLVLPLLPDFKSAWPSLRQSVTELLS